MVATDMRQHQLWQHPLFEGLAARERLLLAQRTSLHTFSRNEKLYRAHTPARHWYLIQHGMVKLHVFHPQKRILVKGLYGQGELVGEEALTSQTRYLYDAVALCDVTALAIPRKLTRSLAHNNPEWMWALMQSIGQRLRRAEQQVHALASSNARGRVVFFLKDLARRHGRPVGHEVLVKHYLTQQEIAAATGTSRQTVTSLLNEWRKKNLIYFTRFTILIRDLERLQ